MSTKKVRGLKRKTKEMILRLEESTMVFPTDFYNGYCHFRLPVAQGFIDSCKTPIGIKRLCIQTLIDRAHHLMNIKPHNEEEYRVVVSVDLSGLWYSQIIIFKGESYFNGFFDRNNHYQKWIPLSKERDIEKEWRLSVSNDMDKKGYKEEIKDEDGSEYNGEIWFIGELV
ncbi:DUF3916 domain-containing protein [Shimazuella kribbensis]|uniref:DUF3916 domain-containing protein n=1 Tax=Shimazuella kribbensis TaxID=139808 RepID=UPI00041EDD38|nr:DUF3916 domain-containing protein [Shimazuella kribbensis]